MTKKVCIGLIFVCVLALGQGRPIEDLQFERLTPNEGLSQSQVTALLQDKYGFMWFGTWSGLNRYDGYQFTVYKHDPSNPGSLSNNHVSALCETRDGNIWVGTQKGLNRYNPTTGVFDHWLHDPEDPNSLNFDYVRAIVEDWEGKLWVGTWGGGLSYFDRETNRFVPFPMPEVEEGKANHDYILALYVDRKGLLWIGTWGDGFSRLNPSSGEVKSWRRDPEDPSSVAGNHISTFYEDSSGNFWVGSWNSGLMLMNRKENRFENWRRDENDPNSLGNNIVRSIQEGSNGQLWLALWGGGVNLFDGKTHFNRLTHNEGNPTSLGSNWVPALFLDEAGILWVATDGMGVARADTWSAKIKRFRHDPRDDNSLSSPSVSTITEDAQGNIWIGTGAGGLNRYEPDANKFTHFHSGQNDESNHDDFIRFVLNDSEGRGLWIGADSGVSLFNPETGDRLRWKRDQEVRRNFPQVIYQRSADRLLVGLTNGGLVSMDDMGNILKEYKTDPNDPFSISDNHVRCIAPDKEGGLWIGTFGGGLNHFNEETGQFTRYNREKEPHGSNDTQLVQCIYPDPMREGILWLGTFGGGLNRFNVKTETFMIFSEYNSDLPNNEVYGILGDDSGKLWISTNRGLCRFDPDTGAFRNFDMGDGLQGMEFNQGAWFKSSRSELYFGGIDGLNVVAPTSIRSNPTPPRVVLTDFKLFNKSVAPSANGPLLKPIEETERIVLAHWQNDISFSFVGLHYSRPEKNRHAFKLENYDQDWNEVGLQRSTRYTNLDPGQYVFRVRASNSDGVMNEEGAAVTVVIREPWWNTGWAYGLYMFLGLALAIMIDHFQRWRFQQKERQQSEIERARLRAEAAESHAKAADARAHALKADYRRQEMEREMLERENTRKSRELEEARILQLSMLPRKIPTAPQLEMAVHMDTATEVGGDYYDFQRFEDGTYVAAVGDATGHGLQAGTMVAATKSLFKAMGPESDPVDFLQRASQALRAMGFLKMYMALMLATFKGRKLHLTSAGMPYALIRHAKTGVVEELILKGMPLGSPINFPYQSLEMELDPGDTLLLMSDGFQELFNKDNEMLGVKRLISWFTELAHHEPQRIIDDLMARGWEWAGNRSQDDDITFLAVKVK